MPKQRRGASPRHLPPPLPTTTFPRHSLSETVLPSQPPVIFGQSQAVEEQLLNPYPRSALASGTASCTVPGCQIRLCNLRSHRQYASLVLLRKEKNQLRRGQSKTVNEDVPNAWLQLQAPSVPAIGREGVDGFPFMPIPDQLDPEYRDLFHHFFNSVFDRLVLIFRAPPISKDFKPRMLQVALTTPSYCMALIAQSRIDIAIGRAQFEEDRKSLALYGKVLEVYRRHLTVVQPAHVDILLLVIVILSTYDMIHGRHQSSIVHWNGMQQLVSFRGGIHNIGVSLAYVVHADRVMATFSKKLPAYPLPADRSIQLMRPPKAIYGSAFSTSLSLIDVGILRKQTLEYCLDTVRLVELFESTQMCFDPKKKAHCKIRDIEYFYYSRDRLDGQFPILYAELHECKSRELCVILAARIAEYPLVWQNYIPPLTMTLAEKLQATLLEANMLSTWQANLSVLSWVLLVAAVAPTRRETHAWMIEALGKTISRKHNLRGSVDDVQPEVWRELEWNNARTFIWSDTHMRAGFDKACDEVEAIWAVEVYDDGRKDEIEPQAADSPDLW